MLSPESLALIPLPDAEVVNRCIIRRALPPDPMSWPPSLQSRVVHLAKGAGVVGLVVLVLSWPDSHHCIAIVPNDNSEVLPVLERPAILAAYRHALRDPYARELFYPLGNIRVGAR